jgi:phage-related holin
MLLAGFEMLLLVVSPGHSLLAAAPIILIGALFIFLRSEWAPVVYVLLSCTFPVLAYGISIEIAGFSLRPHTAVWILGIMGGITVIHMLRQRPSARELPVWGLILVVILSWSVNRYETGILSIINPIMTWGLFLVTMRLGHRLPAGWVIATFGITGVIISIFTAGTVISRSRELYENLFSQAARYLPLYGTNIGGGRGLHILNSEGFLLITFCLMMTTFLASNKHRWLTGSSALVIGLHVLFGYYRSYVIVYMLLAVAIPWIIRLTKESFWRRAMIITLIVLIFFVGVNIISLARKGQIPMPESVQDLLQDWAARWERFYAYDARLNFVAGSAGGTVSANIQAMELFSQDVWLLLFGRLERQNNTFSVDVSGPLGIMVRWGVLGLLMIVWFIIGIARSALVVLRSSSIVSSPRILAYALLFSLFGFAVYSTLRFPSFADDADMAAWCLLAGLVESVRLRLDSKASHNKKLQRARL